MKSGQNPKYTKEFFQPVNKQEFDFLLPNKLATRTQSKNVARKSKKRK